MLKGQSTLARELLDADHFQLALWALQQPHRHSHSHSTSTSLHVLSVLRPGFIVFQDKFLASIILLHRNVLQTFSLHLMEDPPL